MIRIEGNMAEVGVPLGDLINAVRAELQYAATEARDQQLQFEVRDVQLELEVATTRTKEGDGGVKVVVLTLGAKAAKADTTTQKVTLSLEPVSTTGSRFRVSDLADRPVPSR
jgi:hypothetical protein